MSPLSRVGGFAFWLSRILIVVAALRAGSVTGAFWAVVPVVGDLVWIVRSFRSGGWPWVALSILLAVYWVAFSLENRSRRPAL